MDPFSRDLTAFMTPFGLMRMATLLQGYTNGVQVFDRVIRKVLAEQIARGRSLPFIDDVGIRPFIRSYFWKMVFMKKFCQASGGLLWSQLILWMKCLQILNDQRGQFPGRRVNS